MKGRLGIVVEITLVGGLAALAAWTWWSPVPRREVVIPPGRRGPLVATPMAPGAASRPAARVESRHLVPRGELGVLPGPLPFPDEIRASGSDPEAMPPAPIAAAGLLRGRVLDLRGRPIAQARVRVSGHDQHGPSMTATTGASGEFVAAGPGPGPYRVAAAHDDYMAAAVDGVRQGEEPTLRLAPAVRVTGFVRERRTRAPVTKFAVEVSSHAGGVRPLVRRKGARFEVRGLVSGPWSLRVLAPGHVPCALVVEVPAPDRPGAATVRDLLVELERAAVVAGRVLDEHGDGVPRATVSVAASSTVTDVRGEFRLGDLPAGEQLVRVRCDGYQDAEVTVTLRSGDETRGVDLRLQRGPGP